MPKSTRRSWTSPIGQAWPVWRDDRAYRKRLLTRFPYVVFYELVGRDRVDVVAVAHARRKPGYWLERRP